MKIIRSFLKILRYAFSTGPKSLLLRALFLSIFLLSLQSIAEISLISLLSKSFSSTLYSSGYIEVYGGKIGIPFYSLFLSITALFLYFLRRYNFDAIYQISTSLSINLFSSIYDGFWRKGTDNQLYLPVQRNKTPINYIPLNAEMANIFYHELFTFHRDALIPFFKIFSTLMIFASVLIFCTYDSGLLFILLSTSILVYYLVFLRIFSKKNKLISKIFLKAQSSLNAINHFIFSNSAFFMYNPARPLLVNTAKKENNLVLNNFYRLARPQYTTRFQSELVLVVSVSTALFIAITVLNSSYSLSAFAVALLGLQKLASSFQQIANSYNSLIAHSSSLEKISEIISILSTADQSQEKSDSTTLFYDNSNIYSSSDLLYMKTSIPDSKFFYTFQSSLPYHVKAPSGYGKTVLFKKILNSKLSSNISGFNSSASLKFCTSVEFYPQSLQLPPLPLSVFFDCDNPQKIFKVLLRLRFAKSNSLMKMLTAQQENYLRDNPLIDSMSFSGGEVQRLWIARLLLRSYQLPCIVILDEPFSALDPAISMLSSEILYNFFMKPGFIFIISSHVPIHHNYSTLDLEEISSNYQP